MKANLDTRFRREHTVTLRRTCLVVDDDSATRRFVRSALDQQGFQVLEALNGVQALQLAEKLGDALDLIVSDIQMPGGDGLTLVSCVRQTNAKIPIVLMSGGGDWGQQPNPGWVIEFIQKPFTPLQLVEAIQRASRISAPRSQSDGYG